MSIFDWLNRNRIKYTSEKWEDTEEGKRFYEKCLSDSKKRLREKEEWERTVSPENRLQLRLFKIFFTIFLFLYAGFLFWGFKARKELCVLLGEFILSGISLGLFFLKPKCVRFPNCFMMPVIAMGCSVFLYVYMGFSFGFNPDNRKMGLRETRTEFKDERCEVPENDSELDEEYFIWLMENNLIEKEEIENSMKE